MRMRVKKLKKSNYGAEDIYVARAETRSDIKKFIRFQYDLYKGDRNFVPPLRMDMKGIVTGENSPLLKKGPYERFIAYKGEQPAGRIIVGIDEELNSKKRYNHGYFTLFECIEDYEVAKALIDTAN